MEDLGTYVPPNFVNKALRHTHQFTLSWDETPAERKQWLESLAEVDDINDDWQEENCPELSRYLAMSDSSDDEEEEEKERKRALIRNLLQEADKAEEKRKRRQQRGLRKGDVSDSESDSDEEKEDEDEEEKEEDEEVAEMREDEEGDAMFVDNAESEESMEASDEDEIEEGSDKESNFFKIVAEKRREKLRKQQKKGKDKNGAFDEEVSDEEMNFRSKKSNKEKMEPTENGEETGKRKRKRMTKLQKAKQKLKEKERPVDPELSLLLSNFKRTTKTPKELVSIVFFLSGYEHSCCMRH